MKKVTVPRLLIVLAFCAYAAIAQVPTIDQSLEMKAAQAPKLSPDGRYVVYLR